MDDSVPTTVVLADTHPVMLITAQHLIEAEADLKVVGSARSLPTAAGLAAATDADVLVLDLSMLDGASREVIVELRHQLPRTAIVILTMDATPGFAPALLHAGAGAYVLKEFAESDLAHAVRQAAGGESFVSAKAA